MSSTTILMTMEDMKSEERDHYAWHGNRHPLPNPARVPLAYESAIPSPPLTLPYQDAYKNSYALPSSHLQSHDGRLAYGQQPLSPARPGLSSHHSYPSLKRPYQMLEEPQQYRENIPDAVENTLELDSPSKPTINPDHRLLSFSRLPDRHTILDQGGRPRTLEINAQIHGMFFLSEIATNSGDSVIIQPELTCYRRNLFQVSGSVTGPTGPLSVLTERGEAIPIVSQELTISAMESVDNHVIRLIVIPWKTPPPNSPEVPANTEQEPNPIPIFQHAEGLQDLASDMTVQSIAWRRLQFRVATANNGRRKELQQHFVLRLNLTATLATGAQFVIGECATAPIVVRGRSPRNFQARKELPLVGSSTSSRDQGVQMPSLEREDFAAGKGRIPKPKSLELPKRPFQFDPSSFPPSPLLLRNGSNSIGSLLGHWNANQHSEPHTAATTPTYPPPQMTLPNYSHIVSPLVASPQSHTPPIIQSHQSHPQPTERLGSSIDPNINQNLNPNHGNNPNHGLSSRPPFYASAPNSVPSNHHFVDTNPRPLKSPRHIVSPNVPSQPVYPSFEPRLGTPFQPQPSASAQENNGYYSAGVPNMTGHQQGMGGDQGMSSVHGSNSSQGGQGIQNIQGNQSVQNIQVEQNVQQESWTSAGQSGVMYAPVNPQPQHHQQQHQQPPQQPQMQHHQQQHYTFPSETYPKEEGQTTHYTWGPA